MAMDTRFFQRDFDDMTVLSSAEAKIIHDQLQGSVTYLTHRISFSNTDVDSGGIYVGLGGVAAAFFCLHLNGVSGGSWLNEAEGLVQLSMLQERIPSSRVGSMSLTILHENRSSIATLVAMSSHSSRCHGFCERVLLLLSQRVTLLEGRSGLYALKGVLSHHLGDAKDARLCFQAGVYLLLSAVILILLVTRGATRWTIRSSNVYMETM